MAQEITIPRLGWSMEEGIFGEWLRANGDFVEAGEMVFLLEGEKAAHEIESLETGYLYIPEDSPRPGETVKVGQVIGFLLGKGEKPPILPKRVTAGKVAVAIPAAVEPKPVLDRSLEVPQKAVQSGNFVSRQRVAGPAARRLARELGIDLNAIPTPDPTGRVLTEDVKLAISMQDSGRGLVSHPVASPRARRRARELGLDWSKVQGTGRNGRVRERDIIAHASIASPTVLKTNEIAPASPGRHIPASKLRLVLAQRMQAGVSQAAPVTLHTKVDADALIAYRTHMKRDASKENIPSYNDILIWLTARTMREQPQLNACWYRDGIHYYDAIHIATAVDTEAGLLAPVIPNADHLTLKQIADETKQRITASRAGSLNQSALQGGTFTITNLGMMGIDAFTPILNLPQAGILGVGRIVEDSVVRDGRIVVGNTMTLSLTFDHRVIDGAPAARWLQRLCELIQSLRHDVLND
jgi:pyruvate dehydrogenase E2 component (dihydrolipoamide acetyltransferase)